VGARQVRTTGRTGSAGRAWWGRVRQCLLLNKTTLTGQSKSQLAIRHAHNIYDAAPQPFVFWVHASTRARFEEAYRGIADRLELPGRHDPKADVLRLVSDWLHNEANGRWTMVLDNVDDVETFFPSQKHKRHEPNQALPTSLAAYLPPKPQRIYTDHLT
jgi:hypothetical protein